MKWLLMEEQIKEYSLTVKGVKAINEGNVPTHLKLTQNYLVAAIYEGTVKEF